MALECESTNKGQTHVKIKATCLKCNVSFLAEWEKVEPFYTKKEINEGKKKNKVLRQKNRLCDRCGKTNKTIDEIAKHGFVS